MVRDIGKQCRPLSDATKGGVWSGSTLFALLTLNTEMSIKQGYKQTKRKQTLLLEMDMSEKLP